MAKEKTDAAFAVLNGASLPETRVRGSNLVGTACIGAESWVFMSPDPYKPTSSGNDPTAPQSWNRYAYVQGDPVNYYDPSGLFGEQPPQNPDPASGPGTNPFTNCQPTDINCQAQIFNGPSTQGTTHTSIIRITNFSTTSLQALAVQNSLRTLQAALLDDPTCSNWLTGNQAVINTLVGNTDSGTVYVGVGNFSSSGNSIVNAVAGVGGTNLPPGVLLTVNLNGAFFNSNASTGYKGDISGGTDLAKVFILLHELGHLTDAADFISNDNSSTPTGVANQNHNNQLIQQNCAQTLDLFGGHF